MGASSMDKISYLEANRRKVTGHEDYSFINNLRIMKLEGWLISFTFIILWLLFTSTKTKIEVTLMGLTYSLIEFSWYMFTVETVDRVVHIAPLKLKGRPGFTSFEQLIGNIMYLPISMSGYTLFFTLIGLLFPPSKPLLIPLRILCFPLNI